MGYYFTIWLVCGLTSFLVDLVYFKELKIALEYRLSEIGEKISPIVWVAWIGGHFLLGPISLISRVVNLIRYKNPIYDSSKIEILPEGDKEVIEELQSKIGKIKGDVKLHKKNNSFKFKRVVLKNEIEINFIREIEVDWSTSDDQDGYIDVVFDFGIAFSINYMAFLDKGETLEQLAQYSIIHAVAASFLIENDKTLPYPIVCWALYGNLKEDMRNVTVLNKGDTE